MLLPSFDTSKNGVSNLLFFFVLGLVGAKALTAETMQPALDKLMDHLITKNVASDIAKKLCDSVAAKLEGKVLGTFESIAKTVKNTLTESLVQILSPKRRVDILRDCLEAKKKGSPYVMSFCGVSKTLAYFYYLFLVQACTRAGLWNITGYWFLTNQFQFLK